MLTVTHLVSKYEIDPRSIPLTDFEIQVLVAAMNEFGFDRDFIQFLTQKGIDLTFFRPKFI